MANDVTIKVRQGSLIKQSHYGAANGSEDGLYVNDVKVVGTQQATITNASANNTVNSTFSSSEVKTALDANGTKINAIIAALKAHGLIA